MTAGAHRFWCHRAYKANLPLRIILMLCYVTAGQVCHVINLPYAIKTKVNFLKNTLYDWVRDHRVHHKYSETDADPHNSNRGFFFAHVGWLMLQKVFMQKILATLFNTYFSKINSTLKFSRKVEQST